jgi:hypothetical protein
LGESNGNDAVNIQNQKYLPIIYEYVQAEHVWKLLKWVDKLSEENKKVSFIHILNLVFVSDFVT